MPARRGTAGINPWETMSEEQIESGATPEPQGEQVEQPNEAAPAAETSQPDPAEEQQRSRGGFQNRIDRLTREKYQLAQEREQLAQRVAEYEQRLQQQPQQQPAEQQQYGSYEEFVAAKAREEAIAAVRQMTEQQRMQAEQARQREAHTKLVGDFLSSANQLAAELSDYEDVAGAVQMGGALGQALLRNDQGAHLAYYLGQNPQEQVRIEQLAGRDSVVAARELARLEAKAVALIQSRSRSSASPQGKPLGVAPAVNSREPSTSDSTEEWMRKRREQLRRG